MTETHGWTMITRGLEVMEKPDSDGERQLCVQMDGREGFFYLSPDAACKLASILMSAGEAIPVSPTPDWQPIETAPKDGEILGYMAGLIIVMEFCSESGWSDVNSGAYDIHPTHWMPLPASPASAVSPTPKDK